VGEGLGLCVGAGVGEGDGDIVGSIVGDKDGSILGEAHVFAKFRISRFPSSKSETRTVS
jgi:outer membrane lipoprotein SlyB